MQKGEDKTLFLFVYKRYQFNKVNERYPSAFRSSPTKVAPTKLLSEISFPNKDFSREDREGIGDAREGGRPDQALPEQPEEIHRDGLCQQGRGGRGQDETGLPDRRGEGEGAEGVQRVLLLRLRFSRRQRARRHPHHREPLAD